MSTEDPSPSKVTNAERLIARDCGSSYKDKLKALKDKRKEQKKADERAAKAREHARARWLKLEKQRRQGLSEEPKPPEQSEQPPIHLSSAGHSDSAHERAASHGTTDNDAERDYVDSIYQAVSMFAPSSKGSDFSRSSRSSTSSKSHKSTDEFFNKRQSRRSSNRDSSDDEPNIETASYASTNTGGCRSTRSAYSSSINRELLNSSTDQSIIQSPSWQEKHGNKDVETETAIHHSDQPPAESLSIFGHASPAFDSIDSHMLFSTVPPLVSQLSSDSFSQMLNNTTSNSPGIISRDIFPSPNFGSQPFPMPSPELPQRYVTPGLSVMSPTSTPISTQTSPNGILLVDRPASSSSTSVYPHRNDAMTFTLPQPPQSFNQEKRARTAFVSERLRGHGSVPDSPVIEPSRHYHPGGMSPRSQSYDPSSSRFATLTPYLQQSSRIARSSQSLNENGRHVENQSMSQFDSQINTLSGDSSGSFHEPVRRAPSRFTFQTDVPPSSIMSPRQHTAPSLLNSNHRHQAASLRLLSLENSRASSSAPKTTLKRVWSQSSMNMSAEHEHDTSSSPLPSPSTALSGLTLDARPSSHQRQTFGMFGPSVSHEELQRLQVQMQQQQMLIQLQTMQNDPTAAMNELQTRLLMDMIEQQKQALQCDAALLNQRYFSQQSSAAQMNLHSVNSSVSFSTFSNHFPQMPIPDSSISQQSLLMFQTIQQQAQFAMHQQSVQQKQNAMSNPNMAAVNQMLLMRAAAAQRHPMSYPENKPFSR